MTRLLTPKENAGLSYLVSDPAKWWERAQNYAPTRPGCTPAEQALKDKLNCPRVEPPFNGKSAADLAAVRDPNTRAVRDEIERLKLEAERKAALAVMAEQKAEADKAFTEKVMAAVSAILAARGL